MTTDDKTLTDEIARALATEEGYELPWEQGRHAGLYREQAVAVLPIIHRAQAEAWEDCAAMAAHHGAFDGARARWLSSMNPYREEQTNG